jgi:hypothetical protein
MSSPRSKALVPLAPQPPHESEVREVQIVTPKALAPQPLLGYIGTTPPIAPTAAPHAG